MRTNVKMKTEEWIVLGGVCSLVWFLWPSGETPPPQAPRGMPPPPVRYHVDSNNKPVIYRLEQDRFHLLQETQSAPLSSEVVEIPFGYDNAYD